MPQHSLHRTLPYMPDQMFDLVADIRRYPEFIKWVKALRVSKSNEKAGIQTSLAEALVAFKGLSETFSTQVKADRQTRQIDVTYVHGPFKRLVNKWSFEAFGTGHSRIHFFVDYEFDNFVLRALARANQDMAMRKIMSSFVTEAHRRYETKPDTL